MDSSIFWYIYRILNTLNPSSLPFYFSSDTICSYNEILNSILDTIYELYSWKLLLRYSTWVSLFYHLLFILSSWLFCFWLHHSLRYTSEFYFSAYCSYIQYSWKLLSRYSNIWIILLPSVVQCSNWTYLSHISNSPTKLNTV